MKTVLFALTLALAMPIGAQTLDYGTLCGATEGTGDNDDFCHLWAQGNHQGMRNALSIAIRTARAAENPNRYYFDRKRGAERGAFIQLKRPWMGDDWQVLRYRDTLVSSRARVNGSQATIVLIFNGGAICTTLPCGRGWVVRVILSDAVFGVSEDWRPQGKPASPIDLTDRTPRLDNTIPSEFGLGSVDIQSFRDVGSTDDLYTWAGFIGHYKSGGEPSEYVRRVVECEIDEFGWRIGEVDVQPDCDSIQRDGSGGTDSGGGDSDSGDGDDGDGDSGGGDDGDDACSVGLVLSPGDYCTFGENRFRVTSDGQGCYEGPGILLCSGNGIALSGFEANRVSGTNDWRIDVLP